MRKPNAWVFDLDDTLMPNVHDYDYPILDACRLILDKLGDSAPPVPFIIALEHEIDLRRRKDINPITGKFYDYSMERFPTSLIEVYREICKRIGKPSQRSVESELLYIGLKAFDPNRYKRNIYPDTFTTLDFIQKRGDLIIVLTKGDKKVQGRKLSALDAGRRFYKVKIVENKKTSEVFKEIAKNLDGYQLFSVGNDYDKDIVPALEAGYRGVWVPVETWEVIGQLGEIRAKVDWSRCVELRSRQELVERYDEVVAGEA